MYETPFTDRVLEYGAAPSSPQTTAGPVVTNGRLFLRFAESAAAESLTPIDTAKLDSEATFAFTEFRRQTPGPAPPVKARALHLANGTYRVVAGAAEAELECRVTAMRHCTACALQTVWCKDACTLVHVVRPPPGMYVTRTELVIRNVAGHALPHVLVEGRSGATRVAYCCVYIGAGVSPEGVRDPVADTTDIESVVRVGASDSSVYMVHAVVHGIDADAAAAFRCCSTHFRSTWNPTESVSRAWSKHALRWAALWRAGLSIEAAAGATADGVEKVRVLNIHLQTALYRLFADFVDPSAAGVVGGGETRLPSDADDFASGRVRALGFDAVRTRARPYAVMDHLALAPLAPWLAASQTIGRATVWTPMLELAGRVNDAWDIYRATLDRASLASNFTAIRRYVDEMVVRVENAGPSTITGAEASTGTVQTRSGETVAEDPYTTGAVARAFGSAEQMSNALRLPSESAWSELRGKLTVARTSAFSPEIAGTRPPAAGADGLVLLHPAVLRPYGNASDLGPFSQLMDGNYDALVETAQGPPSPAAFASIAALAADVARAGSIDDMGTRMDACEGWLTNRCADIASAEWGLATLEGTGSAADVLACMSYGFLRVKVRGYVTRDGVHTVPAKLVPGPSTAILPSAWRVVRRRVARAADRYVEHLTQNARE